MSQSPVNLGIERKSVVEELVRVIKEQVTSGAWSQVLPAERELSDILGVSRSSLRLALQRLEREGLIAIQHGRRCRVLDPASNKAKARAPKEKMLVLVSQQRETSSTNLGTFWLPDFRQVAAKQGWLAISDQIPRFRPETIDEVLQSLREKYQPASWLLVACDQEVHKAFQKTGWPTLVCGTGYPEVALPCVDVDHRAACRHAVGHLASLGHKSIGLVISKNQLPGDLVSEAGFHEGVAAHRGEPILGRVIRVDSPKENIFRELRKSFREPQPATALIVCRPRLTVTVITCLAALGKQVPGDVSIICREYNSHLHDPIWPTLTTYYVDAQGFSRKILGLCRKLASGDKLPQSKMLVIPSLNPGHSVSRQPNAG